MSNYDCNCQKCGAVYKFKMGCYLCLDCWKNENRECVDCSKPSNGMKRCLGCWIASQPPKMTIFKKVN